MTWRLRDGVSWTPTEYGGVLLDGRSGEYWTLNATAAVVLGNALAGLGPSRIAAALTGLFELEEGAAVPVGDVRDILDDLVGSRLVEQG